MVGGTSIGAFVGALYCEERDAGKVEKRSRPWAHGMARYVDKIFDLTYPSTSYFTGTCYTFSWDNNQAYYFTLQERLSII